MTGSHGDLFEDLRRFIVSHGIDVRLRDMDVEKPGEFDGPTITINPKHDREAASFYLAHSFGSIYQWSTDFEHAQRVFEQLRDAKKGARHGFETALDEWRLFEQTSSEYATGVLGEVGHTEAIEPYTVFFRADIEAMTVFHRTGKEPTWPDFFAEWKENVSKGKIRLEPFRPKPVSRFRPARIEKQEVLQERDAL
jgi:hypothetical protein